MSFVCYFNIFPMSACEALFILLFCQSLVRACLLKSWIHYGHGVSGCGVNCGAVHVATTFFCFLELFWLRSSSCFIFIHELFSARVFVMMNSSSEALLFHCSVFGLVCGCKTSTLDYSVLLIQVRYSVWERWRFTTRSFDLGFDFSCWNAVVCELGGVMFHGLVCLSSWSE